MAQPLNPRLNLCWYGALACLLAMSVCKRANGQTPEPTPMENLQENQAVQEQVPEGPPPDQLQESSSTAGALGNIKTLLPNSLKNQLLFNLSLGEGDDNGILGSNLQLVHDSYSSATASLAYDLTGTHSDYYVGYTASYRYYNQYTDLNVLTNDFSLVQVLQMNRHLTWTNSYRFTDTPEYAPGQLADTLSSEDALANPTAPTVNSVAPASPPPADTAAGDGLLIVHTLEMLQTGTTTLTDNLNDRTIASMSGSVSLSRFTDGVLLASNGYSASAGLTRIFSQKTTGRISYMASLTQIPEQLYRSFSQSVNLSVQRQLSHNVVLSVGAGPSWLDNRQPSLVALPAVVSGLLGTTELVPEGSGTFLSTQWVGNASLNALLLGTTVMLTYNRSIGTLNGLAGSSSEQGVSLALSRQLGRRTQVSTSVFYSPSYFLGVDFPPRLDQQGLTGNISEQISSATDMSIFINYTKVLMPGSVVPHYSHNTFGVNFGYHFARGAR